MATDASPYPGMVIVCERSGRIAAALRTRLPGHVPILETRTVDECHAALAEWPASFVVLELTVAALDRTVRALELWGRQFPQARCTVVAERQLEPVELLLREAGAVHVLFGMRDMQQLSRVAGKHAQKFRRPATLAEEIWQRLPLGVS
jgi:hypothetical protein